MRRCEFAVYLFARAGEDEEELDQLVTLAGLIAAAVDGHPLADGLP